MKHIARSALVERSAAEIYALVEDIESYPGFVPRCTGATVKERKDDFTIATLTFGIKGLQQSFTTENTNVPGRSIDMRLVEGPFRHFAAGWRFTPLEPNAVKIEFRMDYEFASRPLAALLEPVFARLADDMVEAFVRRARSP